MVGEHEIRTRSYLLWEADGRPHGRDMEFWLRAQAELEAESRCAGSSAGAGGRFVVPRVPISLPPRRRLAVRVQARSRIASTAAQVAISASL